MPFTSMKYVPVECWWQSDFSNLVICLQSEQPSIVCKWISLSSAYTRQNEQCISGWFLHLEAFFLMLKRNVKHELIWMQLSEKISAEILLLLETNAITKVNMPLLLGVCFWIHDSFSFLQMLAGTSEFPDCTSCASLNPVLIIKTLLDCSTFISTTWDDTGK